MGESCANGDEVPMRRRLTASPRHGIGCRTAAASRGADQHGSMCCSCSCTGSVLATPTPSDASLCPIRELEGPQKPTAGARRRPCMHEDRDLTSDQGPVPSAVNRSTSCTTRSAKAEPNRSLSMGPHCMSLRFHARLPSWQCQLSQPATNPQNHEA
jgi:hypothetical protein